MGTSVTTAAGQLRAEILRLAEDGVVSPVARMDLHNRVAGLVLRALRNRNHPLYSRLQELWSAVHEDRRRQAEPSAAPENPPRPRNPLRLLFMPQPGMGNPALRRHWELKLLLLAAASSDTRGADLAKQLRLSFDEMSTAMAQGSSASADLWSSTQYLMYLADAVALLNDPNASSERPLVLDGKGARDPDGRQAILSPQSATFLRLLLAAFPNGVSHAELRKNGINNPAQAKRRLIQKLRDTGMAVQISGETHRYRLEPIQP